MPHQVADAQGRTLSTDQVGPAGTSSAPNGEARGPRGRLAHRIMQAASRLRRQPSVGVQRWLLGLSLLGFLAAAALGLSRVPELGTGIVWPLLGAGLLLMPANVALNAAEFVLLGRMVGGRVPFRQGVKVTLIGSAANLLPVPGSTLVRVQALAAARARYRDAIMASVVLGLVSLGGNLLLAGLTNGLAEPTVPAALAALAGSAVLAASTVTLGVVTSMPLGRTSFAAMALEMTYATLASFRLWLILGGLGLDVSLPTCFALTATGAVATAVGFFPGGLGIREAVLGAISPLVGIPAAVGLAGAVVERLFWFVVLAISTASILLREGRDSFTMASESSPTDESTP